MHTVVNSFLRRVTHVHVLQCFALNIHENIGKSADPLARRRVGVHGQSRFHCYIRCRTATRCYQLPATPATTQFSDGLMELIVL